MFEVGIEQVHHGEAELHAGDLAGKQKHFVQKREHDSVNEANGYLAEQGCKSDLERVRWATWPPAEPTETRPRQQKQP